MSYYDDPRYVSSRDRDRYARSGYADPYDDPRGRYARHDYVPRESTDTVEEIQREYPPGSDSVYERKYTRRPRRPVYETVRRASSVGGYDPRYDAAYTTSRSRRTRQPEERRSRRARYESDSSPSRSPPPRHRRKKSFSEQALGALGLGGAAAASHRDRGRDRSRPRHRDRSYSRSPSDSRSRSRSRSHRHSSKRDKSQQRIAQAARAALTAGAVEAFKQRKEPGDWAGQKGKRVLTAAVTAGGADGLVDKDPSKHGTRHVVESTLAGLAASHFIGGGSRSRSKSRGRGGAANGLKTLAATGALTAAGKEIFDRVSRSRSRPRGRDDSRSDDGGSRKRSKSVSDYLTKGMAALGLGEQEDRYRDRSRDRDDRSRDSRDDRREHRGYREHRDREHRDDRQRHRRRDNYSDSDSDADSDYRDSRRGRGSRDVGRNRSVNGGQNPPYALTRSGSAPQNAKDCQDCENSSSDSDIGDSSDERKKRKKLKRDMLVTGGLASVATIHAAHGLYGSMEKRKKRMQQLDDGEITAEEARKRRMKANTMDAVSIGLAALGIKGAYGEWKEVNEKRKETSHFREECAHRAAKREMKRAQSQRARRSRWPDEIEDARSNENDSWKDRPVYRDGNPYGNSYGTHEAAPQISY